MFLFCCWAAIATPDAQTHWTNYYPGFEDIASDGKLVVAVGDVILLSEDLETWRLAPVMTSNSWSGVVYAQDRFFVLEDSGRVASSSDGNHWSIQDVHATLPIPRPEVRYQGIYYLNGYFFILAGHILISTNGFDWAPVAEAKEYASFRAIASGDGRIVVGGGGGGGVATSTNALAPSSWSFEVPFRHAVKSLSYFDSRFFAVTAIGDVFSSFDGTSWILQAKLGWTFGYSLLPLTDEMFASGGEGDIYRTIDGSNWKAVATGVSRAIREIRQLDDRLFACGPGGMLLVSQEGDSWRALFPLSTTKERLYGAASDGRNKVAVGNRSTILHSVTGSEWFPVETSSTASFHTVAHYQGKFVTAGTGGEIHTSSNGVEWRKEASPTSQFIGKLSIANNRLFGAGWAGVLVSSTNGSDWDMTIVRTNLSLGPVLYADGIYVVGGARIISGGAEASGGAAILAEEHPPGILISSNLTHWQGVAADFGSIYCGAYGNGAFVLANASGKIARSTDGLQWFAADTGAGILFEDAIFANGRFYLASYPGSLFTSSDGIDWETIPCSTPYRLYGLGTTGNSLIAVGELGALVEAPFDVYFGAPRGVEGQMFYPIYGPGSGRLTIETSTDLRSWETLTTVTGYSNPFLFPLDPGHPGFFRALHQPE